MINTYTIYWRTGKRIIIISSSFSDIDRDIFCFKKRFIGTNGNWWICVCIFSH